MTTITTLTTYGHTYELDYLNDPSTWGTEVWVVRITDEIGRPITSARIADTQDNAITRAGQWLNSLCRRNPGQFLKFEVTRYVEATHG